MVACLTWPHAYAQVLSPRQMEYMLNLMYAEAVLEKQMQTDQHFFVACRQQEVVGFAATGPVAADTFKLHKLYVLPFLQQSGAGTLLLKQVEKTAMENGAMRLQLAVNRNNNAKIFYEKMGFGVISEGDFEIGAGFFMNDYIMEKQLV
jgi:ribosomal protein S18 acetylase RimI-like enzyme